MELEFDVKIEQNILYDYMLHHTYSGFSGVLGTVVGALICVAGVWRGGAIYLVAGLVILIYNPVSLFFRSAKQMKNTPAFAKPLHYKMTEEGMFVSQDGAEEFQEWASMYKATSSSQSIILYTTPFRASIFPRKDLKENQTAVIEIISKHMPPAKVKIKA